MISSLKKLYELISKKDKVKLFFLLVLMIVGSLLEMIGIGSIYLVIYILSKPKVLFESHQLMSPLEVFYIENPIGFFLLISIIVILFFLIKNVFLSYIQLHKIKFSYKQQVILSNTLLKGYLQTSLNFHHNRNSSETIRNVTSEIQIIINQTLMPLLNLSMDVLLIVLTFSLLFFVEPVISLVSMIVWVFGAFVFIYFTTKNLKEYGKQDLALRKKRNRIAYQAIIGQKELRIYDKSDFFLRNFNQSSLNLYKAQTYKLISAYLPKPFFETFAIIGIFMISLIVFAADNSFDSVLPLMALFIAAAAKILPSVKQTITNITHIRYSYGAIPPVYADIIRLRQIENKKTPKEVIFDKLIEIENVSFRYPDKNQEVIKALSLKLYKGKHYRITGPSGKGKTTLLELIAGLISPQKGSIKVDGIDIREKESSWMKIIGYVSQNVFLFDDTIENNIAIGLYQEQINQKALKNAIQAACLEEFIDSLPEGLKTKTGEQGIRISGGQRQRIGIARSLYHNPELLILDEATSEIDFNTEKQIFENLFKIKGLTIIYVSHRESVKAGVSIVSL